MALLGSICVFINFATLCIAIPWSGPRQTNPVGDALINENGWTPIPTMAPMPKHPMVAKGDWGFDRMRLLAKRQDAQSFCGIYNADGIDTKLACSADNPLCIVSNTYMDCCNGNADCAIYTTCYDASNTRGSSSSSDDFAYDCSGASDSLCLTYYRTDGPTRLTGYRCGTTATSITVSLSQPPTTSRGFAYTPPPAISPTSNGGGDTNIGAIVGGVLVGVAVIALICGLGYFFCIKKRKSTSGKQPMQPMNYAYGTPELQGQQIHEAGGTAVATGLPFGSYYKPAASSHSTSGSYVEPQTNAPPVFHEMPVNERAPQNYQD